MPYNLEKCKIHQFDDVTGDYVTKMKKKKKMYKSYDISKDC